MSSIASIANLLVLCHYHSHQHFHNVVLAEYSGDQPIFIVLEALDKVVSKKKVKQAPGESDMRGEEHKYLRNVQNITFLADFEARYSIFSSQTVWSQLQQRRKQHDLSLLQLA